MLLHSTVGFQSTWGNLCAPPLQFGRRPPQSNCPPGRVPGPDHGPRWDIQTSQGGISTLAPSKLAPRHHSLPPILHRDARRSLPSYSKGSRGLSVLLWVNSIYTANSISLSPWLRQWGSRYAIRAGRNLPDKEFRYLRTVIVTAAVYWGFGSKLRLRWPLPLTFQHRAGVRPYTSSYRLRRVLCFW